MSVKIKCPVCDGEGKVPGNFGGRCGNYCDKIQCPACCGSGMQEIPNSCYKLYKRCDRYVSCPQPYIPCTPQIYPWTSPVWYNTTGTYTTSQQNAYTVSSVTNATVDMTRTGACAQVSYT